MKEYKLAHMWINGQRAAVISEVKDNKVLANVVCSVLPDDEEKDIFLKMLREAPSIFDLATLRRDLSEQLWCDYENGVMHQRRVFLGTVFSLLPSGQYNLPWNDINPHDAVWHKQAELELRSIGCSLEFGEDDPCDLFAVEYRDAE